MVVFKVQPSLQNPAPPDFRHKKRLSAVTGEVRGHDGLEAQRGAGVGLRRLLRRG